MHVVAQHQHTYVWYVHEYYSETARRMHGRKLCVRSSGQMNGAHTWTNTNGGWIFNNYFVSFCCEQASVATCARNIKICLFVLYNADRPSLCCSVSLICVDTLHRHTHINYIIPAECLLSLAIGIVIRPTDAHRLLSDEPVSAAAPCIFCTQTCKTSLPRAQINLF